MENNKIPHQINNIVDDNLKALAQLFPSSVKDGRLDIEALKEELGEFSEVGTEKYELTWSGKQQAKKLSQQDVFNRTLKYIQSNSKNPDTTENLYIEGDNLEVLKLLRQNYYGAIKMIYIDPPYNTGNDFVYNDKFAMNKRESDIAEGACDEDGDPLQKNQNSHNKYHANWLNMMYPRLKIAKDLLTDDGVIFISIDDKEVENLKKICNEIFGESNFVGQVIWECRNPNTDFISIDHEYCLCYAKIKNNLKAIYKKINGLYIYKNNYNWCGRTMERTYNQIDENGEKYRLLSVNTVTSKQQHYTYKINCETLEATECTYSEIDNLDRTKFVGHKYYASPKNNLLKRLKNNDVIIVYDKDQLSKVNS